jgi:DNA-binding ferritin-like protein
MEGIMVMSYKEMQDSKNSISEDAIATQTSKQLIQQFVMKLFDARTSTHVQHLQVSGNGAYAKHQALAGFYGGIVGLADSIVESWQGIFGEILQYPSPAPIQTDSMATLTELRTWIQANRYMMCDESEIQNEVDGVLNLINSTVYKLTFLK